MSKMIFSGIQPSGNLHIGNYIGAIKQWVDLQKDPQYASEDTRFVFMLADLHTMTLAFDPEELRKNTINLTALYVAAGLDVSRTSIFKQSDNPDHPYLSWIFDCLTPMGWLERMTQFKDKAKKEGTAGASVGLFHYPTLMAADILLYDADFVPVGEDQTQHIELARDIAEKFNNKFGEVFKIPKGMIQKDTGRIMSLQDPRVKMSKSDRNEGAAIGMLDEPDIVSKKISRAVTDSGSEVLYRDDKPAISNLLLLYSELTGKSIVDSEAHFSGKNYGDFKKELAEVVVETLRPVQTSYHKLANDPPAVYEILNAGRDAACAISSQKIKAVQKAVGLSR